MCGYIYIYTCLCDTVDGRQTAAASAAWANESAALESAEEREIQLQQDAAAGELCCSGLPLSGLFPTSSCISS